MMAFAVPLSLSTWMALLNNFAVEVADFSGREMGCCNRCVSPGIPSLCRRFVLLLMREQTLALIALLLLGLGTALTGFFPSLIGLCLTTLLMSTGFHYYETVQTSLAQQWIPKSYAAEVFGRLIAFKSLASIASFH